MITDNVAMLETGLSIVDWVYFKTQTLLATLKTQNRPWEEFDEFSEVERLFLSVGCVRNKLQYLTVPLNLKLFLWLVVCASISGICNTSIAFF